MQDWPRPSPEGRGDRNILVSDEKHNLTIRCPHDSPL